MNDTRGEQRFAAVTYSKLVEWTGLKLNTVRHYATRGAFDRWDISSVLTWVNGRRASLGLPLIGLPQGQFKGYAVEVQPDSNPHFPDVLEPASSDHPETENTRQATTANQTGPQVTEQTADTPGSDG